MENLQFKFNTTTKDNFSKLSIVLVGVVSSGNLEVMIQPDDIKGVCEFEVNTSAAGFGKIWEAVLSDFVTRHQPGNLRFSINDMGASPPVVGLRLNQAMTKLQQEKEGQV